MCEFKVVLKGETVFEDMVFCTVKNGVVLLKDILGQSMQLPNCHIIEVNVPSEKVVLKQF